MNQKERLLASLTKGLTSKPQTEKGDGGKVKVYRRAVDRRKEDGHEIEEIKNNVTKQYRVGK